MTTDHKKKKLIVYIFLIVITSAVFWQVYQYEFIDLDDSVYVLNNQHIQSGITSDAIRWSFSTLYAEFWHPVTWFSLMFDYQFYGFNAGGYHLTNIILHILSTLLLFWIFNRMTGEIWKSAFVAAIFALHPLHVESVAWIAKRKDVLSGFFWMLTLCFYVYYTQKPVIKRYLLVVSSFALALMSKPIVVTLPMIMILLDYWPLRRFASHKGNRISWQIKEKMPFFILSGIFTVLTYIAHHNPHTENFPPGLRIGRAFVSFVNYIEKTFWPADLAVYYPFSNQLQIWQVTGAVILMIFISFIIITVRKRHPYLLVGWFWYVITLLPVIGIFQAAPKSFYDHYAYLPTIGITMMLAWGIPVLFLKKPFRRIILFASAAAIIMLMVALAGKQCGFWKNNLTLFGHALHVTRNNAIAHNFLALELEKQETFDEALYHFDEAIRIIPDYADVYFNKGNVYIKLGQYQKAIAQYQEAIRLKPYYAEAYNCMGSAYADTGQYEKALEYFNKSIRLKKNFADAYYNRGLIYIKLRQDQLAFADFNESIRIKPMIDAYYNRGVLYLNYGYTEPGCKDARRACDLGNCKLLEDAASKGVCRER